MQLAASNVPNAGAGLGNDYWDPNAANPMAVGQAAAQSDFTALGGANAKPAGGGAGKAVLAIVLSLVVGVIGYGVYLQFVENVDPIERALALINGELHLGDIFGGGEDASHTLPPAPMAAPKAAAQPKAAPKKKAIDKNVVAGNPYWHLPNAILGANEPMNRLWTAEEEETFRAGLAHRYAYQRWKTVMDVRTARLKGSEAILWDAMQDKKLWTRMYAAVGLTEFDIAVSTESIDAALANARSELIADFFERFIKQCTPGQCFLLRQAIRLMDEKGRLIALQGIARSNDDYRELYLTAATLDPGPRVQRWIKNYLINKPIDPDRYTDLLAVARGESRAEDLLGTSKKSGKGGKNAARMTQAEGDQDLDKEMAELDEDAGDLEIYEPEGEPTTNGTPEDEGFEYAE